MMNPILLIAIPLGLAFSIPLFEFIYKGTARFIPSIAMLFNLALSLLLVPIVIKNPIVISLGGGRLPFYINLFAGPAGILLSCIISLVGLIVSIYALGYINAVKGRAEKYHILYLLLLTGATGLVLTGDIFNLFVFYEILCISSYALVAYSGSKAGVEAASKYLIQGSIGSAFVLLGIALIYGQFGTLNMADIAKSINLQAAAVPVLTAGRHSLLSLPLFVPLALFITGFGVEAAIFPLNSWLPDAHPAAPSPVSAVLSSLAIKTGVYAIFRIVLTIFGYHGVFLPLLILAMFTLFAGEFSAYRQNNLKRMLAYSSIGQIGLIVLALSLNTQGSVSAGIMQIINHALSKAVLFLAAGFFFYQRNSFNINELKGVGSSSFIVSFSFAVGFLSLIGIPPLFGFLSKLSIFISILRNSSILAYILIFFLVALTAVEAAYFFRVFAVIFSKEGRADAKRSFYLEAPVFILAAVIILLGIFPYWPQKMAHFAASDLMDKAGYIKAVLGGV